MSLNCLIQKYKFLKSSRVCRIWKTRADSRAATDPTYLVSFCCILSFAAPD